MQLFGDILRGHTEAIILSILEKKDNYGYQINAIISETSNEAFMLTEATLYTCFKRLELQGLILSYWQDGVHIKRKYYSITKAGLDFLENHKKNWHNAKIIIDKFLEEENGKEN